MVRTELRRKGRPSYASFIAVYAFSTGGMIPRKKSSEEGGVLSLLKKSRKAGGEIED